jgi:hypothetical protein
VIRHVLRLIALLIMIAGGTPPATADDTIETVLQKSIAARPPDYLRIRFYSRGSPFGTTIQMEIRGDGTFLRYDQKSQELPALENRGKLRAEQMKSLLRLLIDIKVWQSIPLGREGVPDEQIIELNVSAGSAEAEASEWQNDLDSRQRLIRVEQKIKALVPAGTKSCVLVPKPPTPEVYAKMHAIKGVCEGLE